MQRKEFIIELRGIIYLLREHSFLRYVNDHGEYELMQRSTIDGLVLLLYKFIGVQLPVIYDLIPIDDLKVASLDTLKRFLKRIKNSYLKLSNKYVVSNKSKCSAFYQAAKRWELACNKLSRNYSG